MRRAAMWLALALPTVLGFATPARGAAPAADAPQVTVETAPATGEPPAAGPRSGDPDVARLVAELTLLGLRVHVESPDTAPAPADVAARVRLDARNGKVEVTFFDVTSGRPTLRHTLEATPDADTTALLVVRTVELVRAVLLPPVARPPAAPAVAAPTAPNVLSTSLSERERLSPPRLALALASGAVVTPGGAGAAGALTFAARLRVLGALGVELLTFAPLTDHAYTTSEGRSAVTTWLLGGGLFARRAGRRLSADGALGALALWLRTSGTSSPGYAATNASAVGAAAYARVGLSVALGPRVAARADLFGGAVVRRPVLAFPDSGDQTPWSRAFASVLAGLEVRWF